MAMVWNNRRDWFNSSGENDSDSFQEHNRRMIMFRRSHFWSLDVARVRGKVNPSPVKTINVPSAETLAIAP